MAPITATAREKTRSPLSGTRRAGEAVLRHISGILLATTAPMVQLGQRLVNARWTPWAALALASALSFLPLRFEGTSQLEFELATQPPAAIVNGTAQLLASRELSMEAVRQLSDADIQHLVSGNLAYFSPARDVSPEERTEAARLLRAALQVEPIQGGRALELTVAAPGPSLSRRAASAYARAMLHLDSETRQRMADGQHMPLPALRAGEPANHSTMPDLPSPLTMLVLALAAGTLVFAQRRQNIEPEPQGIVGPDELPREVTGTSRIIWLDEGTGKGLALNSAIHRLEPLLSPAESTTTTGRLALFTSDDEALEAGRSALSFARHMAESASVVTVFLEEIAEGAEAPGATAPGVRELLNGQANLATAISRDTESPAHIIRAGNPASSGNPPGYARRLAHLLDVLRQVYEIVVVCAPTISTLTQAPRLAGLKPLTVCVQGANEPATAAVESFDALCDMRFHRIAILRLEPVAATPTTHAANLLPEPTLEAAEKLEIAASPSQKADKQPTDTPTRAAA
ncbi:hypothetical protein ACT6QH_03490 [Xanthobacter sp. TB0139]|uniref:hypothetical protein n=1 Tax=Xanthobacter sp. TB0139 TaxID=3459178 RepID=UPI00403950B8